MSLVLVGHPLLLLCWFVLWREVLFCMMCAILCCLVSIPLCVTFLSLADSCLLLWNLTLLPNHLLTFVTCHLSTLHVHLFEFVFSVVWTIFIVLVFFNVFIFFCFVEWGPVVHGYQVSVTCVYFIRLHFSWLPHLYFLYGPLTHSGTLCRLPVGWAGVLVLYQFPTLVFWFGGMFLSAMFAYRCVVVFLAPFFLLYLFLIVRLVVWSLLV